VNGRGRVAVDVERVEPLLFLGEFLHQVCDAHGRVCGQPLRGDAQGEREVSAVARHRVHGRGFLTHPLPAGDPLDELGRALRSQLLQRDPARAVAHDQPAELVAAGDEGAAGGRRGQQGPDLVDGRGVVQQHQHPLAVQQRAVEGGAGVEVGGYLLAQSWPTPPQPAEPWAAPDQSAP
jgi:hypothetical protein